MKTLIGPLVFTLCLGLCGFAWSQEKEAGEGRLVTIEVAMVELSPRSEGLGGLDAEAVDKFVDRIKELESQGKLAGVTRVRLSTVENQLATAQYGERASVVTGRMQFGGGGRAADFGAGGRGGPGGVSFTQQNYGTLISVMPRVEDDGAILIKLQVEKSGQAKKARPDEPKGEVDAGLPPSDTTINTQTVVRVPNGKTVIAHAMETSSEKDSAQTLILVTARVNPIEARRPAKVGAAEPDSEIKIFNLRFAKAADAAKTLTELLDDKSLKIAVHERTNTLLVQGPPAKLQAVEAILEKLDSE